MINVIILLYVTCHVIITCSNSFEFNVIMFLYYIMLLLMLLNILVVLLILLLFITFRS